MEAKRMRLAEVRNACCILSVTPDGKTRTLKQVLMTILKWMSKKQGMDTNDVAQDTDQ
jgi:hypothetical protein